MTTTSVNLLKVCLGVAERQMLFVEVDVTWRVTDPITRHLHTQGKLHIYPLLDLPRWRLQVIQTLRLLQRRSPRM